MTERINRGLDGVYFRVERNGKWESICFSDLVEPEMDKVLEGRSKEWIKEMCKILGTTIRYIGDQFDITSSPI